MQNNIMIKQYFYLMTIFTIISCNTKSQQVIEKIDYLRPFEKVEQFPSNPSNLFYGINKNREIPKSKLNEYSVLVNEMEANIINHSYKYYFGFKLKLNDSISIYSITRTYLTKGDFRNLLDEGRDVFLMTYNCIKNRTISQMLIVQSDPILRSFTFKNDTLKISSNSYYFINNLHDKIEVKSVEESKSYLLDKNGLITILK